MYDYLTVKLQRKVALKLILVKLSLFDRIGASSAIDRTASKYLNVGKKVRKIRKFIERGAYDAY